MTRASVSPSSIEIACRWAVALVIATLAVLTFAHPSATRMFTWPWVGFAAAFWFAPIAGLLFLAWRASAWQLPPRGLTVGLLGLALSTVLSAITSPFPFPSLLRTWPTLSGIALLGLVYAWLAVPFPSLETRRRQLTHGLAIGGAALAFFSVVGWLWLGGLSLRNEIPFGHSNYTAGALLLVIPWLILAAIRHRHLFRWAWVIALIAALIALVGTSSRGATLALVFTLALVTLIALRHSRLPRSTKLLASGAIFLLGALTVLTNPRLRDLVVNLGWSDTARESNEQRSAMLQAGTQLGALRPLLGWGPGIIPLIYPKVRAELNGGVDNVLQLHDTPLQIWASLGSAGTFAAILLLAVAVQRLTRIARSPRPRAEAAAAATSVFAYGLFSLTDHQLDLPALNVLLVINLALLFDGVPPRLAHPSRLLRLAIVSTLAITFVALLALTGRDLLARLSYDQALTLIGQNNPTASLTRLDQASDLAPYDPYYRHQAAGLLLAQRRATEDPDERLRLAHAAAAQLESSLTADCFQEFAHFNLGWLNLDFDRPLLAVAHFAAAAREAPNRAGVYFGLGLALQACGRADDALRAFALEWVNDPSALAAPVWEIAGFDRLRSPIAAETGRLLQELASSYPQADYNARLLHWWFASSASVSDEFESSNGPLSAVLTAWRRLPDPLAFADNETIDPTLQGALLRRAARHPPPNFHSFITAGVEEEPVFLVSFHRERPGYGVLTLHPEGPVLRDLYVIQENRFLTSFAPGLFPKKGWLPGRELLARLPADLP